MLDIIRTGEKNPYCITSTSGSSSAPVEAGGGPPALLPGWDAAAEGIKAPSLPNQMVPTASRTQETSVWTKQSQPTANANAVEFWSYDENLITIHIIPVLF